MACQHIGRKVLVCFLIIATYLGIRWMASRPADPHFTLHPPNQRLSFKVNLKLPTLEGMTWDLADLSGQVILLNFWATWCYPCRVETPSMQAVYTTYQSKGFTILAIASDAQGMSVVSPFAQEHGLTFPILLDSHNWVGERLHIPGIPTSYLLDKQSRIAAIEVGARDWNSPSVRRALDELLAESATPPDS